LHGSEYPKTVEVKKVAAFDKGMHQTAGTIRESLMTQREWRSEFDKVTFVLRCSGGWGRAIDIFAAQESTRIANMKAEAAAIMKGKSKNKDLEATFAEFSRKYDCNPDQIDLVERKAALPDPVLYPLDDYFTGIPRFDLVMRVDIQGKFQKEKSLASFQNSFGGLPQSAMLEITEMIFESSSSRNKRMRKKHAKKQRRRDDDHENAGRLRRDIFLPDPRPVQPYTRLKMFRPDEASLEGFQTAGCHSQYYTRMMQVCFWVIAITNPAAQIFGTQVVRACEDAEKKIMFVDDYFERVIQQHVSNLLNNGLRR